MPDTKAKKIPEKYELGFLNELDSRLAIARDMRLRFDQITSDLGGADSLSYMQLSLIERACWLEHWIATQERQLASNADFDIGGWSHRLNTLLGLYRTLGLKKQAKTISLGDFAKKKHRTGTRYERD